MATNGGGLPGRRSAPQRHGAHRRAGSLAGRARTFDAPDGLLGAPDPDPGDAGYAGLPDGVPPQEVGDAPPRPTRGLELQGEYQQSGFTTPRYLVRRSDGQVIQLSRLLYLVASAIDGRRAYEAVAHRVSGSYGRSVTAEDVEYLVERKLRPLGVVAPLGLDPQEVKLPKTDLLLTLRAHKVLLRPPAVRKVAAAFSWLHRPAAVTLVLSGALAADAWLFAVHGAMPAVLHTVEQPVLLLIVFALTVGSTVFHEFGHASGCRYGGANPGCIGCGIYLVWPAMYTDVTDVYRLKRSGRLRTDLGGVYFNVVFMLALFGGYFSTGQEFFLTAVYLTHFEVLEQLLPALRLDGYYILADLAGVPDLFGKVGPVLRSMIPGRPTPPEVAGLKRSSRVIVTAWVVSMVPLILGELVYALWNLPRLLATSLRSLLGQLAGTGQAFAEGELASALLGIIGIVMLVLPTAGLGYLLVRIGGRLAKGAARVSRQRGTRGRLALLAVTGCIAVLLVEAWAHGLTPRPLPPNPPVTPALQPNAVSPPTPSAGPALPGSRPSVPADRPSPSAPLHSPDRSSRPSPPSRTRSAEPTGAVPSAQSAAPGPAPSSLPGTPPPSPTVTAPPSSSATTPSSPTATPAVSPSPS